MDSLLVIQSSRVTIPKPKTKYIIEIVSFHGKISSVPCFPFPENSEIPVVEHLSVYLLSIYDQSSRTITSKGTTVEVGTYPDFTRSRQLETRKLSFPSTLEKTETFKDRTKIRSSSSRLSKGCKRSRINGSRVLKNTVFPYKTPPCQSRKKVFSYLSLSTLPFPVHFRCLLLRVRKSQRMSWWHSWTFYIQFSKVKRSKELKY